MGEHCCRHPCWHRAVMLLGTGAAFHLLAWLLPWTLWGLASLLVSTWLWKHLLQWRCQGHTDADRRRAVGLLLLVGSAALMMHDPD